jgi:hypothetical protein
MKCFTAQQSPDCCVGIGRDGLRPGDHPREPDSRPKRVLKRGIPRRRSLVRE